MAGEKAYRPFAPGRRPGGKPPAKPKFRVLVHHQFLDRWNGLVDAVGLESAQQFYDHVSQNPGQIPAVNTSGILRGKAARPREDGFSRTVHYEISGARSEEHTSELQSLMRISYAVFCLKKKTNTL